MILRILKVLEPLKSRVPEYDELKEGDIIEWDASRLGRGDYKRSITIKMDKLSPEHAAVKLVCLPDIPVDTEFIQG